MPLANKFVEFFTHVLEFVEAGVHASGLEVKSKCSFQSLCLGYGVE